jgi:hypothetical protein
MDDGRIPQAQRSPGGSGVSAEEEPDVDYGIYTSNFDVLARLERITGDNHRAAGPHLVRFLNLSYRRSLVFFSITGARDIMP